MRIILLLLFHFLVPLRMSSLKQIQLSSSDYCYFNCRTDSSHLNSFSSNAEKSVVSVRVF